MECVKEEPKWPRMFYAVIAIACTLSCRHQIFRRYGRMVSPIFGRKRTVPEIPRIPHKVFVEQSACENSAYSQ